MDSSEEDSSDEDSSEEDTSKEFHKRLNNLIISQIYFERNFNFRFS